MASGVYNQFKTALMNGTYALAADTIKVILLNNSHTFDPDTLGYSNVSANELATAGGYTAGGATLGSVTITQDNTDDEGVFDALDTAWAGATFTAYHAAMYDDTPVSPADPLMVSIDFGGAQAVSAGTFTIVWAAEGIINIG